MNDTKTITTDKPAKIGGKNSKDLLECVKALKEMGAVSVSVSSDRIDATFPPATATLHVEPIKDQESVPMVLGYPADLLMAST